MYDPPIQIMESLNTAVCDAIRKIQAEREAYVFQVIENIGVIVDKEELIKALQYDRGQYDKGYKDGYLAGIEALAKRLKEKGHGDFKCCTKWVDFDDIDNLVKELKELKELKGESK